MTIDHDATGVERARDRDGRLSPALRNQRPLRPDSLVWKYFGDHRLNLLLGRAGTTENMYPQLGQAVSDHSVIFTDLFERVRRSLPPIANTVYGDAPTKTGLQIRNFHKPLAGTMSDGSKYHGTPYVGLDPETFYWAHATFIDQLLTGVERFIKPLTLQEKEQIFAESRDWYSLYGVDDSFQPRTYTEFVQYWDRVVADELVGNTKVAQYTVGYITKGLSRAFPVPKPIPPLFWNRLLAPVLDRVGSFLGAGGLDPALRDKLGIPWSARQEARYRRFCATVRALGPVWERLAPVWMRYMKQAVDGFEREHVDPRTITARPRAIDD
ncbi:oxygenase MpaB family protein [Mycolicibacterium llatzerense]|uniref:oxygenase MpaB family protein n=1 Tax=Mycolicibacterium llatzerense TaxID=280871 RepID=UPI0005C5D421|nr:oxygenase MpaB family protein [Mycolicibacterium llatzerense]MCT7362169.1 hypothetical protein [Mycolicibacterium llatzerense]MCT7368302.1 hypothetical protein [Mycolicibacterium llatzerense]